MMLTVSPRRGWRGGICAAVLVALALAAQSVGAGAASTPGPAPFCRHVAQFGVPFAPTDLPGVVAATKAAAGAIDTISFVTWVVGAANQTLAPPNATLLAYFAQARAMGLRVLPIVAVSPGVPMAGTAAYAPLVAQLAAYAARYGWAGLAFDAEMGSNKALAYKLREFLNAAADALHPHGMEVQWFIHGGWHPSISAASRGDVMWDMDSYRVWQELKGWTAAYGAKGGVGLSVTEGDFPTTEAGMEYLFGSIYDGDAVNLGFWCCWGMGPPAERALLYPHLRSFLANSTCK